MSRKNRPQKHQPPAGQPRPYAKRKRRDRESRREPLVRLSDLPFAIIILAYIFVVTFTPNWMALDTNATKFLTLSGLNLVSFVYLISRPGIRKAPGQLFRFFNTRVGLAYSGFLVVSLLSFTQSINIHESVLHFTKLFSVFTAVFVLSAILMHDIRYVRMIVFVMTALLIFDALSVFYYINKFIQGDIARITEIKTVYSNKNILASSIYVKLPFALSMLMFDKGWMKRLGWFSLFVGILATFFMATRTFYLGLILLSLAFLAYTLIHYLRKKETHYLKLGGAYIVALALALTIHTVVQRNFYPERGGRHTRAVTEQLATITSGDASTNRTNAWRWSAAIIKANPLLGVGSGNWKINVLEYENQVNPGFIYLYKAHNDFLENTAETGIVGGMLFLSIFVLMGWALIGQYRKKADDPGMLFRAFFLSASGLAFYAVDAFFNFPADRPEILLLFALFMSMGIAASVLQKEEDTLAASGKDEQQQEALPSTAPPRPFGHPLLPRMLGLTVIALLAGSSYIIFLNYDSSRLQRTIYQEIMGGNLRSSSDDFVGQFPAIPNISMWGESISTLKARYLLNEGRSRETIGKLINERGNPYDARREFYLAQAYHQLEMPDSVLHYAQKAYALKPNYFSNIHLLIRTLEAENREIEVGPIIEDFLEENKTNARAWLYATGFQMRQEDPQLAYETIQEAREHLPSDSLIQNQYRFLHHHLFVEPHSDLLNEAVRHYNEGAFAETIAALDRYMEVVHDDHNAYRLRAISYYRAGEYQKSIDDIEHYFSIHELNGSLLNLRGVNLRNLGDLEGACRDFEAAMRMGIESARNNYMNFCREEE